MLVVAVNGVDDRGTRLRVAAPAYATVEANLEVKLSLRELTEGADPDGVFRG